jgi:hypothetical protein
MKLNQPNTKKLMPLIEEKPEKEVNHSAFKK